MNETQLQLEKLKQDKRAYSETPGSPQKKNKLQKQDGPNYKSGRSVEDGSHSQNEVEKQLAHGSHTEGDEAAKNIKKRQALTIASISDENNDEKIKQEMQDKIDANLHIIDQMQKHALDEAKGRTKSVSTDDCIENETVFKFMKYGQRMRHMRVMWIKTFTKAKAGSQILHFTSDITKKIQILGIRRGIDEKEEEEYIHPIIIMPSSLLKTVWNMILIILLIYTATLMPFSICFITNPSTASDRWDIIVNLLFSADIFINFISAVDFDDGTIITNPKLIAQYYFRTWLAFDISSILPVQYITYLLPSVEDAKYVARNGQVIDSGEEQSNGNYNQLVRLVRLPRLYRMVKILRLLRVLKILRKNRTLQKLQRALKMNAAIMRLIQGLISAILATHIFACFWFLCAQFNDLGPNTWVWNLGLRDAELQTQYLWAMHWAVQTITTVGYGDVKAHTHEELLLSFVWMLVGVAFYSFIIGNFSTIVTQNSQLLQNVQYRVQGLQDLSRKANMPFAIIKRIKVYVDNNYQSLFSQDDEQLLIQTLPPSLRDEILRITYGEIIGNITFFKSMVDSDFLWKILPVLRSIKLEKNEVLYWKGDTSDEFYFIVKGTVKLYNEQENPFIKYTNGDMFGDSDALLDLPRDSKATAMTHCNLKSLQISQFEKLFLNSEDTCLSMIVNGRRKRDKHQILMKKANQRFQTKKSQHSAQISELVKSINYENVAKTELFASTKNNLKATLRSKTSKSVFKEATEEDGTPKSNFSRSKSPIDVLLGFGGRTTKNQPNLSELLKEKDKQSVDKSDFMKPSNESGGQESPRSPVKDFQLQDIRDNNATQSGINTRLPPMDSVRKKSVLQPKKSSQRLRFDRLDHGMSLGSTENGRLSNRLSKFRDSKETLATETHRSAGPSLNVAFRLNEEIKIEEQDSSIPQIKQIRLKFSESVLQTEELKIEQQALAEQRTLDFQNKLVRRKSNVMDYMNRFSEELTRKSQERHGKIGAESTGVAGLEDLKKKSIKYFGLNDLAKDEEALKLNLNPRQTLVDKLVGNVFGKDKDVLYKDYPDLINLTVSKNVILTPKGREIIKPQLFRKSMDAMEKAALQSWRDQEDQNQSMTGQNEQRHNQNMAKSTTGIESTLKMKSKRQSHERMMASIASHRRSYTQPSANVIDSHRDAIKSQSTDKELLPSKHAEDNELIELKPKDSPNSAVRRSSSLGDFTKIEISTSIDKKIVHRQRSLSNADFDLNILHVPSVITVAQISGNGMSKTLGRRDELKNNFLATMTKHSQFENGQHAFGASTVNFQTSVRDVKININLNAINEVARQENILQRNPISSQVVGQTAIEIMDTLELIAMQYKRTRVTLKGVAEDQNQVLAAQGQVKSSLDNIIGLLKRSKQLKTEIHAMPRPVVDEYGQVLQKAIKTELTRGVDGVGLKLQKPNQVRPMNF